jgi:hypothetical protein
MIETVILMPLYMILIFGLIFFGYSTLAKQKEAVAAGYSVTQSGRQSAADMMPMFFPWNPQSASDFLFYTDGSGITAGDARLRVHDLEEIADVYRPAWHTAPSLGGVGDTFDHARVAEYLWIMGLPTYEQHFEWVDGQFREVIITHENYKSSYLHNNGIVDRTGPPSTTVYTRGATYGVNCAQDRSWLDRRDAWAEYFYTPPFFSRVYGETPQTSQQYFAMDYPTPAYTPDYKTESHLIARGDGRRQGTLDVGAGPVIRTMEGMIPADPTVPDPLDDTRLDAVKFSLWPADTGSLWISK